MFHHHSHNANTRNGTRYEVVPQADHEVIELGNDPSYNYNTAIPNSPPPSFHSSQSTPAVSVADFENDHDRTFNNATPTPRDPSSVAGMSASGNDALVVNLHRRVERLEEAIGRLLLEKSDPSSTDPSASKTHDRSNCCVTFPNVSDLTLAERAELLRAPSNCCVRFGGRKDDQSQRARRARQTIETVAIVVFIFAVMGWVTLLVWPKSAPRVVGCEACYDGKGAWTAAGQGEDGAWSGSG